MAKKSRPRLTATRRERTGRKSDVRRLRRTGMIPGSIFGHGDPETITFSERALSDFLHHHSAGAILDIDVEGSVTPALIREVDRHPLTGHVIHLGVQRVNLQEVVRATLPIMFTGEESLVGENLVSQHQMSELEVHGKAELLPEALTVDLSGCTAGQMTRVKALPLPKGLETRLDPETVVVIITLPTVSPDVAAALDAEEAAHLAAAAGTEEEKETESGTEAVAQEE